MEVLMAWKRVSALERQLTRGFRDLPLDFHGMRILDLSIIRSKAK